MDHLEKHSILTNIQHGFRQKRSCETQLITTLDDFNTCLNKKGQIDSILLDFSKAFDKVDHLGLLTKLDTYGISNTLLEWLRSFLLDRTQTVIVEGKESNKARVTSGVPQGTVLGPLLFLMYINDIDKHLTPGTKLRLFADDSFLYREIKHEVDCKILQNDLNALQQWEKKWKMEFHPDKCQVLRITNKKKQIVQNYVIHGKILQETKQAKYLGVIIDDKLQWSEQNKYVCKKANNILAFLKRNTNKCPQKIKEKCCNALVKPILNYGCSVWDPHHKNQIENLDKVQKNAGRYVTNDYSFEKGKTNAHMKQLNWLPLGELRARTKLTTFYNGINNHIHIPIDHYTMNPNKRSTRQSGYQVFDIPQSSIDSHLHSFFPSTIRLWNSLPTTFKMLNTTDQFKNCLQHISVRG